MMKTYILFAVLLLIKFSSFSFPPLRMNDTVNVWLREGIRAYDDIPKPGVIFSTIPYGTKVTIMDTSLSDKPFTMSFRNEVTKQTHHFKGYWVLVKYGSGDAVSEDFVFSGFLSKKPCFKITTYGFEEEQAYFMRNYSKPTVAIKKVKESVTTTRRYKKLYC